MRILSILLLLTSLLATPAGATTVVPPSFADLVSAADAIYRGRVTAVESRPVDRTDAGTIIKTFVTVAVERVLKGPEKTEVTLEFLGGTVGDESMTVSGMPTFSVGAREVVFVQKNGVQFCPLVAFMHGRYRVVRDEVTAREHVARDNGLPLTDTAEVELPMQYLPESVRVANAAANRERALTPEAFEARITAEVKRNATPLRTN